MFVFAFPLVRVSWVSERVLQRKCAGGGRQIIKMMMVVKKMTGYLYRYLLIYYIFFCFVLYKLTSNTTVEKTAPSER